jgi:hypothetical protein
MPGPSNYYPGVYRGTVFSNKDPLNQGRLRLKVPQLFADSHTEWAWPINISGVQVPLPDVGQGVWVMFEGGDPAYPVWHGVFGKDQSTNSKLQLNRLDPDDVFEEIDFLIEQVPVTNTTTELDVTQTLLNLATKLMERNYGSFYDTTTQTQATINTPQAISLNTVDFASNMSIVDGSKITISNVGTYNLQWSGQFSNTDSSDHDVRVWLRYNGVDYPNSNSIVTIPARHGSINGHIITAWNWLGKSQAPGDYVQIMWSTDSTAVSLQSYPADAVSPAVPSAIVTLTECE